MDDIQNGLHRAGPRVSGRVMPMAHAAALCCLAWLSAPAAALPVTASEPVWSVAEQHAEALGQVMVARADNDDDDDDRDDRRSRRDRGDDDDDDDGDDDDDDNDDDDDD